MTGPKYPLRLRASRLDGGAPPRYPLSPKAELRKLEGMMTPRLHPPSTHRGYQYDSYNTRWFQPEQW